MSFPSRKIEIRDIILQEMKQDAAACWSNNKMELIRNAKDAVKDVMDAKNLPASLVQSLKEGDGVAFVDSTISYWDTLRKYANGETKLQECIGKTLAAQFY